LTAYCLLLLVLVPNEARGLYVLETVKLGLDREGLTQYNDRYLVTNNWKLYTRFPNTRD